MKNNQNGFTLIEMMIVLLVISVLLIVTIPNIAKHNSNINNKGCEVFMSMVEAQVQAYRMEHKKFPTIEALVTAEYLNKDHTTCPNGDIVEIGADGKVTSKSVAGSGQ